MSAASIKAKVDATGEDITMDTLEQYACQMCGVTSTEAMGAAFKEVFGTSKIDFHAIDNMKELLL